MIRKATMEDVAAIAAIYEAIHDAEESGAVTTGWIRHVYPTAQTARDSCAKGDEMYVLEEDGLVRAAARINQCQGEEYQDCPWQYPAADEEVLVLHTLVVDPQWNNHGCARAFVAFYEAFGREMGCKCLRMDTNARNKTARAIYQHLGYSEAGIVPCVFNGIPNVQLVCLEKKL